MLDKVQTNETPTGKHSKLPIRLHHNAWVVENQERTRAFYEDVLGMPLTAFWIEQAPYEGKAMTLSHAFYGLADGSALAFFCLAEPDKQEKFKSPKTEMFNHVALTVDDATQAELKRRADEAKLFNFTIEHGYCRSLYMTDPDGLRLEFAVDSPDADQINAEQRRTAHDALKGWMDGNRVSNNNIRH